MFKYLASLFAFLALGRQTLHFTRAGMRHDSTYWTVGNWGYIGYDRATPDDPQADAPYSSLFVGLWTKGGKGAGPGAAESAAVKPEPPTPDVASAKTFDEIEAALPSRSPMRWNEVHVFAATGTEFGIVEDLPGCLTIATRRPGEEWPKGATPVEGVNTIGEGFRTWVVVDDAHVPELPLVERAAAYRQLLKDGKMDVEDVRRIEGLPSFGEPHPAKTANRDAWLPLDAWSEAATIEDPASLAGDECYGGLDVSATTGIAAFTLVFPPTEARPHYAVLSKFWAPIESIQSFSVEAQQWSEQGDLTATLGDVLCLNRIIEEVMWLSKRFRIKSVAYDAWNAAGLADWLEERRIDVVEFRRNFATFSLPCREFERLLAAGQIAHDGNAVLHDQVAAAQVMRDGAGNMKPSVVLSGQPISGIVGALMALGVYLAEPKPRPEAQQPVTHDVEGKPIANSAGEPFPDPVHEPGRTFDDWPFFPETPR